MSLARIFVFSLVLALLCVGAFWVMVPQLVIEPWHFDLRAWGYDLADTRAYLAHLEGSAKLTAYLTIYRWIDFVFPVAVFGVLASTMWVVWRRATWAIALLGVLMALGYLVADYVENAAVLEMLLAGSVDVTLDQVITASSATQGKWVAIFASLGLIGLGLVVGLFRGFGR